MLFIVNQECQCQLTSRTRAAGVQHLHVYVTLVDVDQLVPQLLVALINVPVSHDVEAGADQRKQGGVEVDGAIGIQSHVHGNKSLTSDAMGTQLAKTKWRRDFAQQCHHIDVFDPTLGVRIVLRPECDELPQVVGTEDGPVPREVVEVVHDDGHEEIEHEEGAEHEKGDEVDVGKVGSTTLLQASVIRLK